MNAAEPATLPPPPPIFGDAVSVYDLTLRVATMLRDLAEERVSVIRMQHALWCGPAVAALRPKKPQMLTEIGAAMQVAIRARLDATSST